MVTQITTTTQTPTPASTTQAAATITSDFDTFLKLLTTQMTNQDPLNPVDSTQFATQLAQFSAVEQQTKTNSLLETMTSQMSLLGMAQLAGWVGQEARSTAPVWVDGREVTLEIAGATGAERAVLVVTDAAGTVVTREEMPAISGQMAWTPQDITGAALGEGLYSLSVEHYRGDERISTAAVQSYGTIVEARQGSTGATLILRGGVEVASSAISALRAPAA